MLEKLTIRSRFLTMMFTTIIAIVLLGGVFFISQSQTKSNVTKLNNDLKYFYSKIIEARGSFEKTNKSFKVIIATKGQGAFGEIEKLKEYKLKFLDSFKALNKRKANKSIQDQSIEIQNQYLSIVKLGEKTGLAYLENKLEQAEALSKEIEKETSSLLVKIEKLSSNVIAQNEATLFGKLSSIQNIVMIITLVFLGLSTVITTLLYKSTNKSLSQVSSNIMACSESNYQLSKDFKEAIDEISRGSQSQASSVHETVATIDEITAIAANNTISVEESATKSEESQNKAVRGQKIVEQVVESIQSISHENDSLMSEVKESNRKISEIGNIIDNISLKTQVINDIVFQTKLLSFNASVEAARAGEYGKGFAVVAEEVGNLAQDSGKAANEISSMLGESIKTVSKLVEEANSTLDKRISKVSEKIEEGQTIANDCTEYLTDIVLNTSEVSEKMQTIRVAFNEQATGISNISEAMNQIQGSISDNNQAVQDTVSNIEIILNESLNIKNNVEQLENMLNGPKEKSDVSSRVDDKIHSDNDQIEEQRLVS